MKIHEGWFEGSLSQRNNNPLNLRATCTSEDRENSRTSGSFIAFDTIEQGTQAAINCIRSHTFKYGRTLGEMIYTWAPPEDGNDPSSYVNDITQRTGIQYNQKLADILIF